MKTGVFTIALMCIIGHHKAFSQSEDSIDNEARHTRVDSLLPPTGMSAIFGQTTTSSAVLGWRPLTDVSSYTLRIYNKDTGILYKEIQNVMYPIHNVTGLQSGTGYAATVSGIFNGPRGRVETIESEPYDFHTVRECTGGQVRTQCSAHCISSCDNPDPICSRICTSGCVCPRFFPIWHDGNCIPRQLCPAPSARPLTPKNLRVLPSVGTTDVFLSWDPIESATSYTVRVRLATDRSRVIRTLETKLPLIVISGLDSDTIYVFSVKANMRIKPTLVGRSTLLPPPGVQTSKVSESGFSVSWLSMDKATRYAFVLYDESRENVLYLNEQIAGNTIQIEGLAPGSIYYYSVATAGSKKNPAIFSEPRGVRTRGTTAVDIDTYHGTEITKSIISSTTSAPTTTTSSTTTTAPTTTTTSTPAPTICQENYARAVRFYEDSPDAKEGPSFPNCDEQGLFVTVVCSQENQGACWCVDAETGNKVFGTDFGGENSAILLNCNKFGSFPAGPVQFEGTTHTSTSLNVRWNSVPNVEGYVLTLESTDGEHVFTKSVDQSVHSYLITDLLPGQTYYLGIFAVSDQGWTSPVNGIEVKTNNIDIPTNLKIADSSSNSVTVRWDQHPTPDFYLIDLINAETGEQIRSFDRVTSNSITINELDSSLEYEIEVRASRNAMYSGTTRNYVSRPASVVFQPPQCNPSRPLDIIYVIDTSRVPSWNGLQKEKNMFVNITSALPQLSLKTGTRVAALRSYRITTPLFHLNKFSKADHVTAALKTLRYNGSPLFTVQSLDYVRSRFFTNENRAPSFTVRPGAASVVIVIFSGNSQDSINDIRTAGRRLANFTNVIAVGIEGQSEDEALSAIASRPDLKITVPSFDQLGEAVEPILQKLCSLD